LNRCYLVVEVTVVDILLIGATANVAAGAIVNVAPPLKTLIVIKNNSVLTGSNVITVASVATF